MSTVTSPDGTVIDYDRYGDGPAVIFIGGASAYRAMDEGAPPRPPGASPPRVHRGRITTGADAESPATPSRGRLTAKSRTSPN